MMRTTSSKPCRVLLLLAAIAVLLLGCQAPGDRAPDASALLRQLTDDVWAHRLENAPHLRMWTGVKVERLPDVSYERARADHEYAQAALDRLAAIDVAGLSHEEVLTWEILKWELEMQVEGFRYFWLRSLVTPYASILRQGQILFAGLALETPADLEGYLDLVAQVPGVVDAVQTRVAGQHKRGIVVSRANLPAVLGVAQSLIQPPEAGMFRVGDERLQDFEEAVVADFRQRLATTIEKEVNPAFQRLFDYLSGEYQESAPDQLGMRQYPDGADYYRFLTRYFTTLDLTPEEVHAIGLEMMAEIEEEMRAIRAELAFDGGRDEFHRRLQSDRRFFPESSEEVAASIQSAADAMFAQSPSFFLRTPRAPYGVRRLDPALEGPLTYGYYDMPSASDPTGYYYYNGSGLDQRSWLMLEALALHELVPGHHFQLNLQRENEDLPLVRRYAGFGAFVEGWGCYASLLGLEAGLYQDPYSRYGLYAMMESFLISRLVVDTGMNYLGWSLDQAREYMRENTLQPAAQIATETLRYSTDIPAQGLGYQIGKRKLLELRRKAEEALGERFDVRRFHDALIGSGAMPLAVLEKHVDWFIEQELERRIQSAAG